MAARIWRRDVILKLTHQGQHRTWGEVWCLRLSRWIKRREEWQKESKTQGGRRRIERVAQKNWLLWVKMVPLGYNLVWYVAPAANADHLPERLTWWLYYCGFRSVRHKSQLHIVKITDRTAGFLARRLPMVTTHLRGILRKSLQDRNYGTSLRNVVPNSEFCHRTSTVAFKMLSTSFIRRSSLVCYTERPPLCTTQSVWRGSSD